PTSTLVSCALVFSPTQRRHEGRAGEENVGEILPQGLTWAAAGGLGRGRGTGRIVTRPGGGSVSAASYVCGTSSTSAPRAKRSSNVSTGRALASRDASRMR